MEQRRIRGCGKLSDAGKEPVALAYIHARWWESDAVNPPALVRVLMLGWELPPQITGGLGRACSELFASLNRRKSIQVSFVAPHRLVHACGTDEYVPSIVAVLPERTGKTVRPVSSYGTDTTSVADYADMCERLVDGGLQFDLIHAHDWHAFMAGVQLKQRMRVPLIVHVHSTEYDRAENPSATICDIEQMGIAVADKVITVSRYAGAELMKRYACDPCKLNVIYNGAPVSRRAAVKAFDSHAPKVVTFIGRLTFQKGVEYFVEAAHIIHQKMSDTTFVIAGEGEDLAVLKSLVRALDMEGCFSFLGFIDFAAVDRILADSHVVVMPSISEPFGLVAVEAASAGCPVVISSRSGVAEVLTAAQRVEPTDTQAIAGAVLSLLGDAASYPARVCELQRQAAMLSWDSAAAQIDELYRTTLHKG